MLALFQDIRFAVRALSKRKGFCAVVVLCLGFAIGANTAIFSFINAILLRPLPVRAPEQLVRIYGQFAGGLRWASVSYPNFRDYQDQNEVFSGIAAERPVPMTLSGEGGSHRILGSLVSANYFSVLGVQPAQGRTFSPDEDRASGIAPVVVLGHGFWRRRFASDPRVVGRIVKLNGHDFKVIGVAAEGFIGLNIALINDVWIPISMQSVALPGTDLLQQRGQAWLSLTARLRPGVSLVQAQSALDNLAASLRLVYPVDNEGVGVNLLPETKASIYPPLRQTFLALAALLQVVVGLVLLVACANVAGLFLVRAMARQKEMAIRLAVGASRGQLIRQLMIESLLLAALAGCCGLLFALWISRLAQFFRPAFQLPIAFDLSFDFHVVAFSLLATLLTGLLFGLAPALQASRAPLVPALKQDTAGQGYRRSTLRSLLVMAQVAISFVLLVGAGLFFRGLQSAQAIDLGFHPDKVLLGTLNLGLEGYDEARGERFYLRLLERVRTLPGVRSASLAATLPFDIVPNTISVSHVGFQPQAGKGRPQVDYNVVAPNYFETIGMPLAAGREFTDRDTQDRPQVVVVNETFARTYWPGQSAVGKELWVGANRLHTVAGVSKDGKYASLGENALPYLYLPLLANYRAAVYLHVGTIGQPSSVSTELRDSVSALDRELVLYDMKSMTEQVGVALFSARLVGGMLAGLGTLALLLAMVGLYATTAFALSRRTREIGIRMALGASSGNVLVTLLRESMVLTLCGLGAGLAAALVLARLIASQLYGVSPFDAMTFVCAVPLLVGLALMANLLPAYRALRISPSIAFRAD